MNLLRRVLAFLRREGRGVRRALRLPAWLSMPRLPPPSPALAEILRRPGKNIPEIVAVCAFALWGVLTVLITVANVETAKARHPAELGVVRYACLPLTPYHQGHLMPALRLEVILHDSDAYNPGYLGPYPAKHVTGMSTVQVPGVACPHCGASPLEVCRAGDIDRRFHEGYDTQFAAVACESCRRHVGTVKHTYITLFGPEEDSRVLLGQPRVF